MVEWIDSSSIKDVWHGAEEIIDEMRKDGLDWMQTIGFVVDITKDYILLAGSLQRNEDWDIPRVGAVFAIPKGCIKQITRIKLKLGKLL